MNAVENAPVADLEQQHHELSRSDSIVSSQENEDRENMLAAVGAKTKAFVMTPGTMFEVVYNIWVQIIRLIIVLIASYLIAQIKPETHMSRLDQQWLNEFFQLFIAFLLVINLIVVLPFTIEAPKLTAVFIRIIFGCIGAFVTHVIKGFSLYDDLTPEELEEG